MFERYTEKARRIIFFARYEASQFGSPYIETEHVLLGVIREDKILAHRFLAPVASVEGIRQKIETASVKREKTSTSVDLPLSNESKRVLAYAAEEADRLSHRHIGSEHLFLGLLREKKCLAAELLHELGLTVESVRADLASQPLRQEQGEETPPITPIRTDLTELASQHKLQIFVGREKEMERLIQVLGRETKNSVVLIGEPGVGRRALAEGLAQRIVKGDVPSFLADQKILDFDMSSPADPMRAKLSHAVVAKKLLEIALSKTRRKTESSQTRPALFFIEGAFSVLAAKSGEPLPAVADVLKTLLMEGKVQCICSATPEEERNARKQHAWLDRYLSKIEIPEMTEADATAVLLNAKPRLENFHSVVLREDVVGHIVHCSAAFIKDRQLPGKALDLMDEAAAYVKSQRELQMPEEIREIQKRIRFIVHRMEQSIATHEFEKARFYSDEERKERENLRQLREKHKLAEPVIEVTREDVEEVLSRLTGISIEVIRKGYPPDEKNAANG